MNTVARWKVRRAPVWLRATNLPWSAMRNGCHGQHGCTCNNFRTQTEAINHAVKEAQR